MFYPKESEFYPENSDMGHHDGDLYNFAAELCKKVKETSCTGRIKNLLENRRFNRMPPDDQFHVLTGQAYDSVNLTLFGHYDISQSGLGDVRKVWRYVIRDDNADAMGLLLRHTPLHAIHKENIPSELQNLIKPLTMRMALRCKRWHGEVCSYTPREAMRQLSLYASEDIMMKIAFTMHAVELFSQCCKKNARKCMEHLLKYAPCLTTMRASCDDNRLPLQSALIYNCPIAKTLFMAGAPTGYRCETLANIYTQDDKLINVREATEMLLWRTNQQVVWYVDPNGNTLLHLLYSRFYLRNAFPWDQTIICTKLLVDSGLDVKARNRYGKTALDVLFEHLSYEHISARQEDWYTFGLPFAQLYLCQQLTTKVFKNLYRCAKIILDPNCEPPSILIPIRRRRVLQTGFSLETLGFFKLVMQTCGFEDINARFKFLLETILYSDNMLPLCLFCKPLTELVYMGMRQGLDVTKPINSEGTGPSLLEFIIDKFRDHMERFADGPCRCLVLWDKPSDCCAWELIEMILHFSTDPDPRIRHHRHVLNPGTAAVNLVEWAFRNWETVHDCPTCHLRLDRLLRCIHVLWLNYPSYRERARSHLSILKVLVANRSGSDTLTQQMISRVEGEMSQVQSLSLLCRQSILQHCPWKDIEHLALPTAIKHFIRIGGLSDNHAISSMIKKCSR